ncbi:hypothetical protein NC997_02805 [Trichocoleus sp. DQ-A2]|uniref:hypothetical protein n=1 Tax=Cyanophyceae TaxID=3028117 RepID=UPI00168500C8|nr:MULTISPECIES: hypothetical protein [unclassified Coleofasciculus]MBD1881700.1 hypothetical protein [Coleofasciculus sp. FACHB-T130]MBD1900217.1 hypothetical protein [Coleofasciculus sp. FACHB-125]MBD1943464.1 hypothetical protein [Coleofasciculus sp. FACHB-712]
MLKTVTSSLVRRGNPCFKGDRIYTFWSLKAQMSSDAIISPRNPCTPTLDPQERSLWGCCS